MSKQPLQPKKPTRPFGRLVFPKSGGVRREMFQLSDEKKIQERQALERFSDTFNCCIGESTITDIEQLPESDHDFIVKVSGVLTVIQLAELVDRTFTFPMTKEEYEAGTWTACIHKGPPPEIPWRLDVEKRDQALADLLAVKHAKGYAPITDKQFWLVVFCTFHYSTEYFSDGQVMVSEGLLRARRFLEKATGVVFNKIWFSDLQSRPIQIWPVGTVEVKPEMPTPT